MNISTLTLRDLEYLVAVAQTKHFGRAAALVHVSQPTLSGQVKKAEEFLGVRLFERTNKRVALTQAGERIVRQAKVVLDEAQKLGALASGARPPLSGAFHLGAIHTLGPYYFPHVLAFLGERFPDLELHLREGTTDALLAELRAGQVDAVLASPTFPRAGLRLFPLFVEPFVLAAPARHELCRRTPLVPADLRLEDLILLEDGHCLKDQILAICPRGRRGAVPTQATSLETLRYLVASGAGYTLFPKLAVREDAGLRGMIRYRPFRDDAVGREVALVCRARSPRMDEVALLAEQLRAQRPAATLGVSRPS